MLVPGIVDSDKRGSALDVVGAYTPCDSLETAYVADNGFTAFADGVWSAVQSEHVSGLAIRSGDYLATRTEDVAILLGVSVQNFVGDALLYLSIYDTGTGTYVGTGIGENINSDQSVFVRMLSADMYGKLRIRIDIIGDTVAFDSITLHSIYTYECQPDVEAPVEDCDPYWDNVVLAMHMDGTDGSASFTDEKGHTVTTHGAASITTADSVFGGASANFPAATAYLTTDNPYSDFQFGTSSFKFSFWIKWSATGGVGNIIGNGTLAAHSSFAVYLSPYPANSITLVVYTPSSSTITVSRDYPTQNQWSFVEGGRVGDKLVISVDGIVMTATISSSLEVRLPTYPFQVNSENGGSSGCAMKIDDLVITKGAPPRLVDFTPPTAPFAEASCTSCDPYWDNVVLLMKMDGNLVDSTGKHVASSSGVTYDADGVVCDGGDTIDIPASTDFADNVPFTLEFDLVQTTNSTTVWFFNATSTPGTGYGIWHFVMNSGGSPGQLVFSHNATFGGAFAVGTITTGVKSHIAITRDSDGVFNGYVDGVKSAYSVSASLFTADAQKLEVATSSYFGGTVGFKMSNLRYTKGVARYTANFTPPTAPFVENNCDTATVVLQTAVTMGWSIGSEVSASASIGWTVGWSEDYEFDKYIDIRWSLAQNIDKSGNMAWAIQTNTNPIDKEFGFRWSIAQEVTKIAGIRWTIQ